MKEKRSQPVMGGTPSNGMKKEMNNSMKAAGMYSVVLVFFIFPTHISTYAVP